MSQAVVLMDWNIGVGKVARMVCLEQLSNDVPNDEEGAISIDERKMGENADSAERLEPDRLWLVVGGDCCAESRMSGADGGGIAAEQGKELARA